MKIYCCQCKMDVCAYLTDGREIYPHRPDLSSLPFWKCDVCKNYVGCHHKTKNRTKPLGNIPFKELKNARQHIHKVLDPIWKNGKMPRGKLYALIAKEIGCAEYHTAEIKTVEEARKIYVIVKRLAA